MSSDYINLEIFINYFIKFSIKLNYQIYDDFFFNFLNKIHKGWGISILERFLPLFCPNLNEEAKLEIRNYKTQNLVDLIHFYNSKVPKVNFEYYDIKIFYMN
jgi:hypothetical protein